MAVAGGIYSSSVSVTITSGGSASTKVTVPSLRPRAITIDIPSAWTAADVGFTVSDDDSTYLPLTDETNTRIRLTNVPTGTATAMLAPASAWALLAYKYFKLISLNTSTGAAANQGADRVLVIHFVY